MQDLSPLFRGIQVGLFGMAGALLSGVLYGMHMKTRDISPKLVSHLPRVYGKGYWEKRRAARLKCNLFVEFLQGDRLAGIGQLVNLSAAGACLASNLVFESGDYIKAQMPTLRKGSNKISGHVVWLKPTSTKIFYGIRLRPATPA